LLFVVYTAWALKLGSRLTIAAVSSPIRFEATTERYQRKAIEMIKVSVLYPSVEGDKFDFAYYCDNHIPMVREKLGSKCKGVAVERGLGGATPGSTPTYIAMGHLLFDSVESFQSAFEPHAEAILNDLPNYTSAQPVIQISEVTMQ
jgi:uncharacterized protein (TIGR02118 family)